MKQNGCSKVWTKVVCIGVLLLAGGVSQEARGDDGYSQAWVQFWLSANLNDVVGVKVAREDRFRDSDEDKYYYGHTELSLPVKLTDHWTLAPAVRFIRTLRGGEWRDDVMPQLNLINKTALGPLTLKNRMRLVKVEKEAASDDPVEYHHRADLVLTKGWTAWNVRPYVAEELFYSFTANELYRSRATGGLLCTPVQKVSVDLYLMREDTKTAGDWKDILVLGLACGYEF